RPPPSPSAGGPRPARGSASNRLPRSSCAAFRPPSGVPPHPDERGRGGQCLPPFFFGTLAPFRRASDRPMATACLGSVTFLPVLPLLSLPSLNSCIASRTVSWAFFP